MKKTFLSIVTLAFTIGYNANARDQIKIVGSSTVYLLPLLSQKGLVKQAALNACH